PAHAGGPGDARRGGSAPPLALPRPQDPPPTPRLLPVHGRLPEPRGKSPRGDRGDRRRGLDGRPRPHGPPAPLAPARGGTGAPRRRRSASLRGRGGGAPGPRARGGRPAPGSARPGERATGPELSHGSERSLGPSDPRDRTRHPARRRGGGERPPPP